MVLYFSATGNTEHVARKCAEATGDECLDLLLKIQTKDYSEIKSEKPFVICSPIYVCEMPNFLQDFLKKVSFSGSREFYFIFTSGGYSGCASVLAKSFCRKHHFVYKGSADVFMPRNYIANTIYPMQDSDTIKDVLIKAEKNLPDIFEVIKNGGLLKSRHVFLFETLSIVPVAIFWIRFKMGARDFYAKDSCIACGKCSKVCPFNNVTITDGRPVWGNKCTHCMACIANCPKESIEYGSITAGKERYLFKKYKDTLKM